MNEENEKEPKENEMKINPVNETENQE